MNRVRQPATEGPRQPGQASSRRVWAEDTGGVSGLRKSWALTRWAVMVVVIGVATGAAIAIVVTFLLNVLDANL